MLRAPSHGGNNTTCWLQADGAAHSSPQSSDGQIHSPGHGDTGDDGAVGPSSPRSQSPHHGTAGLGRGPLPPNNAPDSFVGAILEAEREGSDGEEVEESGMYARRFAGHRNTGIPRQVGSDSFCVKQARPAA